MPASARVLTAPVSCQAFVFGTVKVFISYNINWSAGQFRPWQVASVRIGRYWTGWCGTWIVEGNNVVVICQGHMLVLKKSWFKVKWTLFRQKQLEDLESSWEANTCFGTGHSGASKRCFGTWLSGTSKTCFETRSGTSKTCFGARHSRRKHAW